MNKLVQSFNCLFDKASVYFMLTNEPVASEPLNI